MGGRGPGDWSGDAAAADQGAPGATALVVATSLGRASLGYRGSPECWSPCRSWPDPFWSSWRWSRARSLPGRPRRPRCSASWRSARSGSPSPLRHAISHGPSPWPSAGWRSLVVDLALFRVTPARGGRPGAGGRGGPRHRGPAPPPHAGPRSGRRALAVVGPAGPCRGHCRAGPGRHRRRRGARSRPAGILPRFRWRSANSIASRAGGTAAAIILLEGVLRGRPGSRSSASAWPRCSPGCRRWPPSGWPPRRPSRSRW